MKKSALFLLLTVLASGCKGCDDKFSPTSPSPANSAVESDDSTAAVPRINGVELTSLNGWFAVIYPWEFFPEQSPIHPVPELFTPNQKQNSIQIGFQEKLLNDSGSSADILSFNPRNHWDYDHWSANYFGASSRPFFLLYEHIRDGQNDFVMSGAKLEIDMNNPQNRQIFMEDIKIMFDRIVVPNRQRYVTVEGMAVIYMWATGAMTGNFPSLLDEARSKYPVFFIGSGEDSGNRERIKSFDGLMHYALPGFGGNYLAMTTNYHSQSIGLKMALDSTEHETGKKIYSFATFQAGYDETLVIPKRNPAQSVYPLSREEMEEHARLISLGMHRWKIYDRPGPLVVFSELPEGGSVIPSLYKPEKTGRYVGYGTGRMDVVKKYFGGR